jgi:hypothetical protein
MFQSVHSIVFDIVADSLLSNWAVRIVNQQHERKRLTSNSSHASEFAIELTPLLTLTRGKVKAQKKQVLSKQRQTQTRPVIR